MFYTMSLRKICPYQCSGSDECRLPKYNNNSLISGCIAIIRTAYWTILDLSLGRRTSLINGFIALIRTLK